MSIATSALTRPRRGRLYIVIGAALAVLAFATAAGIASLPLLQGSTTGTRVVVASHDIKARTLIQSADLTLANFQPAPPQAFTLVKDVAGKGARVDIPAGSPVTANVISSAGDILSNSDVAFLPIPKGWVAVTVPTSEQVGVGGYVQIGDRITMLATVSTSTFGQSPGVAVVRTVFRDVDVIRVGPVGTGGQTSAAGSVTSSLTVLMTACDSEFLFWLLNNAQMKYELESYTDYANVPTQPDDKCPSVSSAAGVGPRDVDKRWLFTSH
ncbi:MAG TPA: RcpC/CpaB family pilus assembly protein [Candidatus Dormibacteraeota bacterium]|nr:RcpC/CpaB family pilus assembly protein [Candidatus Dormibacteraeota bacterium]